MTRIKFTVSLSVEVDADAWDLAYGTGTDPAAVRDDVRAYLADNLPELHEVNGLIKVRGV
jgi:hypothetical protein